MLGIYIFILGVVQVIVGVIELLMPTRAFNLWTAWISHRFFRLHGILLIAIGLSLSIYTGGLSTIIFIIGIILIITGPFLLIYPEKMRSVFNSVSEGMGDRNVKSLMYGEAAVRIAVGALFITGPLL